MWKAILLVTLWIALAIEVAMTALALAAPATILGLFKINADSGTLFLGHVIGWFFLIVDALIAFAIWNIRRGNLVGWEATYLLGTWWLLLGISIYVFHGRPDNLLLDSLKGAILLVAAVRTRPALTAGRE